MVLDSYYKFCPASSLRGPSTHFHTHRLTWTESHFQASTAAPKFISGAFPGPFLSKGNVQYIINGFRVREKLIGFFFSISLCNSWQSEVEPGALQDQVLKTEDGYDNKNEVFSRQIIFLHLKKTQIFFNIVIHFFHCANIRDKDGNI